MMYWQLRHQGMLACKWFSFFYTALVGILHQDISEAHLNAITRGFENNSLVLGSFDNLDIIVDIVQRNVFNVGTLSTV